MRSAAGVLPFFRAAVPSVVLLFSAGCGKNVIDQESTSYSQSCELPSEDRAWLDSSMDAWRITRGDVRGLAAVSDVEAVFFSERCALSSNNALSGILPVLWESAGHDGKVRLPDGTEVPVVVTSFTRANAGRAFFAMSTPSVWSRGGVDGGPLGLETLMTAVLLHEGAHVAQIETYGKRVTEIEQSFSLPPSFGDDSLQTRFQNEVKFAESIRAETELFFQAAFEQSVDKSRELAIAAREMMKARAERWYIDDEVYWRDAEDIWLTFEGSGQWVGFHWLTSRTGAAVPLDLAMDGYALRSKWWSQNEGLAIALVLDRLTEGEWRNTAFGDGAHTILEMLDAQLGKPN